MLVLWIDFTGQVAMRDVLSHHYFDLNNDIVFDVCINEIPKLKKIIKLILVQIPK